MAATADEVVHEWALTHLLPAMAFHDSSQWLTPTVGPDQTYVQSAMCLQWPRPLRIANGRGLS